MALQIPVSGDTSAKLLERHHVGGLVFCKPALYDTHIRTSQERLLRIAAQRSILSVPVWNDEKDWWEGICHVFDVALDLVRPVEGGGAIDAAVMEQRAKELKERTVVQALATTGRTTPPQIAADTSILEAARLLCSREKQYDARAIVRQVNTPIPDTISRGSSSSNNSNGLISPRPFTSGLTIEDLDPDEARSSMHRLVTLTDIARYITLHSQVTQDVGNKTLEQVGALATGDQNLVTADMVTIECLQHLQGTGRDGAAIVNSKEDRKLVGGISTSQIRGLRSNNVKDLLQPCLQFVKNAVAGRFGTEQTLTASPSDTLLDCLNRCLAGRAHRIFVVDDDNRQFKCTLSFVDLIKPFLG
eukprot:Clim_evm7s35 gene=Clim_evmTU7s35